MALTQARAAGAFTGRRYGSFEREAAQHPVDRITQARSFGGHTGARYGSFEGRGDASEHPVDRLSQARAFGAHTGARYRSFAGRTSGRPVDRLTQVRAFGAHTGARYGAFSGRTAVEPPVEHPASGGSTYRLQVNVVDMLRKRRITEDELLLLLAVTVDGNAFLH